MFSLEFLPFLGAFVLMFILWWIIPSKGKIGENRVARRLGNLPETEYRVFNDVVIPTSRRTSQIDHIVVSEYGIFVIETKTYDGWIYGGEHSEYWTQNIYGYKSQFYNPILQNAGHVRVLRQLLKDYGDIFIYPIVTFSRQADLKLNTTDSCVIYWNELTTEIQSFTVKVLTRKQVEEICHRIEDTMLDPENKEILKAHKHNVACVQARKEASFHVKKCPRCGAPLVERHGKYGSFWGCSNFPKCRYTHD